MSKADKKKQPKTLYTRTYDATKPGWAEFTKDARSMQAAGYDLRSVVALGTKSFGVVWILFRRKAEGFDLVGSAEDGVPFSDDDGHISLED